MVDLNAQGYPLIIWEWCLVAICTPFVFIRIHVQLHYRTKPWREIFVILAWLLCVGCAICDSILNDLDVFNEYAPDPPQTDEAYYPQMKTDFAWTMMYLTIMYACKAAMLCLYMDITPRHIFPRLWWSIVVVWFLLAGGVLVKFIAAATACPFSANYTFSQHYQCSDSKVERRAIAQNTIHIATDIIIFLLPIAILRSLPALTHRQKLGALAMFGLGFFNILSAIELMLFFTYIRYILKINDGPMFIAQDFLLPFQSTCAIIIVCMPYCRRIRHKPQNFNRQKVNNRVAGTRNAGAGTEAEAQDANKDEETQVTVVER